MLDAGSSTGFRNLWMRRSNTNVTTSRPSRSTYEYDDVHERIFHCSYQRFRMSVASRPVMNADQPRAGSNALEASIRTTARDSCADDIRAVLVVCRMDGHPLGPRSGLYRERDGLALGGGGIVLPEYADIAPHAVIRQRRLIVEPLILIDVDPHIIGVRCPQHGEHTAGTVGIAVAIDVAGNGAAQSSLVEEADAEGAKAWRYICRVSIDKLSIARRVDSVRANPGTASHRIILGVRHRQHIRDLPDDSSVERQRLLQLRQQQIRVAVEQCDGDTTAVE